MTEPCRASNAVKTSQKLRIFFGSSPYRDRTRQATRYFDCIHARYTLHMHSVAGITCRGVPGTPNNNNFRAERRRPAGTSIYIIYIYIYIYIYMSVRLQRILVALSLEKLLIRAQANTRKIQTQFLNATKIHCNICQARTSPVELSLYYKTLIELKF